MRIVVCVKHVPDTQVPIRIDDQGARVVAADVVGIMNPADACAVEAAVQVAEQCGGEVTLVSLGTREAINSLRQGLAIGAHRAILVTDAEPPLLEPYVTAMILAHVVRPLAADLVLCGASSLDNASGQVGAILAEAMDIPHVSGIASFTIAPDGGHVTLLRKLERGHREEVQCILPAVLIVDIDLNQPRYPALPALIDALTAPVEVVEWRSLAAFAGRAGSQQALTRVVSLAPPRPRPKRIFSPSSSLSARDRLKAVLSGGVTQRKGNLLEGAPELVARQVVEFLTSEKALGDDQ